MPNFIFKRLHFTIYKVGQKNKQALNCTLTILLLAYFLYSFNFNTLIYFTFIATLQFVDKMQYSFL